MKELTVLLFFVFLSIGYGLIIRSCGKEIEAKKLKKLEDEVRKKNKRNGWYEFERKTSEEGNG